MNDAIDTARTWRRSSWAPGLVVLVLSFLFSSQSLSQSESFSVASWGTRNGLPETVVRGLVVQSSGGLLVGTTGGICVFDGFSCMPFQRPELSKLPARLMTVLYQGKDKSLWTGTDGGGLLHITPERVELFDQRNGLINPYIRAVLEDSRGQIWVGTDDGLFRKSGDHFERISLPKWLNRQGVYALAEDQRLRLIIGGAELAYVDETTSDSSTIDVYATPYPIRSILLTKDRRLLIGTLGGLFENLDDTFKKLPFPNGDVERLCESTDGSVWVGTVSNGLWLLRGSTASKFSLRNVEPNQSVIAIAADANGRLWVGSETGLIRIEPTNVHLIDSPADAVDSETLALSPEGEMVLANNQAFRLGSEKPEHLQFLLPGSPKKLLNVLYASDRSTWLGTAGNGVYHLSRSGKVTQFSTYTKPAIAGDFPRGIVEGLDGDIWIATSFGLSRIWRGGVEAFDSSNGLPSRNIRALLRDHRGCMWIGTDSGAAVYCSGKLMQNRVTKELGREEITALAEDQSGTLWLGTRNHGVYAYRGSYLGHLTVDDGLLSNFICSLFADGGLLWITSPEAISSIRVEQPVADARSTNLVFARPYLLPKGSDDLRFSAGRFPGALADKYGRTWFASNRGPIYVERSVTPAEYTLDRPTAVINSVRSDDVYVEKGRQRRIPAATKLLMFTINAVYLGSEQDVLLAYRLEGADDKWTATTANRQIEYRRLPPGSYAFEVRAYKRSDPATWTSARFSFIVPVPWYRSVWFYTLAIALSGVLFLVLYALYLHRVRTRFKLILEERARLAREMHDTLIQGCNGVAMLLEAEAGSRIGVESKYLDIAREQLQATVADARNAVWNLRQSELSSDLIEQAIRNISAQAMESFNVPVTVSCRSGIPRLRADMVHEILMVVREAVTNAGSHGRPNSISISIQRVDQRLLFRIVDDGIGFNVDAALLSAEDHYGILGMHERAEAIGADLKISSAQGAGTTVSLSIDMAV